MAVVAELIYGTHGCTLKGKPQEYLFKSLHPTEQAVLAAAEAIFEMFCGDAPDYSDDDMEA